MADQKDSTPSVEAEMKVEDMKPETKTTESAPPAKKLWSDEDFGEVDFSGLKMAVPEDIVDQPERIKSETITEPESIKKVC